MSLVNILSFTYLMSLVNMLSFKYLMSLVNILSFTYLMSLVNILALHILHVIKQITWLEVHERFRFILFKHDVVVNSWTIRTTASVTSVTFPAITETRLLKYIEKSTTKKKNWYFSYFFSQNRLRILDRIASARRF